MKSFPSFYHIKNLQSTKTNAAQANAWNVFYHIKNLQSTKTADTTVFGYQEFYHIKNLQSTKTNVRAVEFRPRFITLRIYKVLKPQQRLYALIHS